MSQNTWNFATWQALDVNSTLGPKRCVAGAGFQVNGQGNTGQSIGISNTMSGVFSFMHLSTYSAAGTGAASTNQFLTSIGVQAAAFPAMSILVDFAISNPALRFFFWDGSAAATRYLYLVGDEDGSSWLQTNKWYQVAFSATTSGLQFVVNGSTTPTEIETTNNPGNLNIDNGAERWWHMAPRANTGAANAQAVTQDWPTVLFGPCAFHNVALDLTSSTVRNRIFDTNGDLKNPGWDGSLWWGDTLGGEAPLVYMPNGAPVWENGSANLVWKAEAYSGVSSVPGGTRKQYEDYLSRLTDTPHSIPGLYLWLDGSDSSTIFQDTNRTAVSDGDPVGQWLDKSGNPVANAKHMTALSTQRPTFKTNQLNGLSVVEADGANHRMEATKIATTVDFTAFWVIKRDSSGAEQVLWSNSAGGTGINNDRLQLKGDTRASGHVAEIQPTPSGTAKTIDHTVQLDTNWHILSFRRDNATLNGWVDGTAQASNTLAAGQEDLDTIQTANLLFQDKGASKLFGGQLAELIIYCRALTEIERQTIQTYLENKWGL